MNKITVIGNLTRDPEQRVVNTARGEQLNVVTINVADNSRSRRQGEQQNPDDTIFYRCSVWGNRGDVLMRYVKKGHRICVIGSLSQRSYTGNDGQQHTSLEIRVDDFELLTTRAEAESMGGADGYSAGGYSAPAAPAAPTAQNSGFTPVESDELPF